MSNPVVRCRCRWLITAACAAALPGCAGPAAQANTRTEAPAERAPDARTHFALPLGATILDLDHWIDTEATSWIDTDLRATRRPVRTGVAEVGFTTTEGSSHARGFGADRETAAAETVPPAEAARDPRPRRLVAPLVVIDICDRAANDRDAQLGIDDIAKFEQQHGLIEAGSAVLVRTCWYWRWGNRDRYLGTSRIGGHRYHFPGVAWPAARALIERDVAAVAIDTAGVDHGPSMDRVVQRTLRQAEIEVFVNIVAFQDLPARGALLMVLPMKIPGSDRTPTRVLALTP